MAGKTNVTPYDLGVAIQKIRGDEHVAVFDESAVDLEGSVKEAMDVYKGLTPADRNKYGKKFLGELEVLFGECLFESKVEARTLQELYSFLKENGYITLASKSSK